MTGNSDAILDPSYLEQLRALGGASGVDIVQKVTQIFLKNAPPLIAAIVEAVGQGHWGEAGSLAHKLKSSSMNVGAQRLVRVLSQIEAPDASWTPSDWEQVLAELQLKFEEVRGALT